MLHADGGVYRAAACTGAFNLALFFQKTADYPDYPTGLPEKDLELGGLPKCQICGLPRLCGLPGFTSADYPDYPQVLVTDYPDSPQTDYPDYLHYADYPDYPTYSPRTDYPDYLHCADYPEPNSNGLPGFLTVLDISNIMVT